MAWRHHPVTQAYHRYLRDYRAELLKGHVARYITDTEDEKLEIRTKIEADVVINMLGLRFEDVAAFYDVPEPRDKPEYQDWRTEPIPSEIEEAFNTATEEEE